MNTIKVELEGGNPYYSGSAIFLNRSSGPRIQLAFNVKDYARCIGSINDLAFEFAYFCAVIYGCDRSEKRETSDSDRWTREFDLTIPVSDPDLWNQASPVAQSMLEFLTGDLWHLKFIPFTEPLLGKSFRIHRGKFRKRPRMSGDAVSLFSGGMDSLIGVINWLEENPSSSAVLAGTNDSDAEGAKSDQKRLLAHFEDKYPGRYQYYRARVGIIGKGADTNFRSRSLTFIGNAVLAASFLDDKTPVLIPENGAIALNFPLTPARAGSMSTRTVHPLFINLLNEFMSTLGIRHVVENPYHLFTKGEMVQQCLNPTFLHAAYSDSVSCGKRKRDRIWWSNTHVHGCGVCVPCIFRRSALLSAEYAEEEYGHDVLDRSSWKRDILAPNGDLQAAIDFVESAYSPDEIWSMAKGSTRLDISQKDDYISLVQRLRDEVAVWLKSVNLI